MEKQKGKLKQKYLKTRNIAIETPVAMDLSTDITRLLQVNRHKKKRISEYMCESIRKTKMKAGSEYQFYPPPPLRPTTAKDFEEFSKRCPLTEMSRHLEKRIRKMIQTPILEKSHPQVLSKMIKETKEEYERVLHCSGINQRIKNCYPEVIYKIEPMKFLGRTENYEKYLLIKKRLKSKWVLHHPIIKKVVKECIINIPRLLCYLKFDTIFELDDIMYTLKDKARCVSQFVYEFYIKISSLVDEEYNKISERNSSSLSYLFACTGIFSIHISNAIARTLLHTVKCTDANQPYVSLNATFNNGLVLSPSAEEIIVLYHNFIDKILESSSELYVLQRKKIRGYENKYMPLCITQEFIHNCKKDVTENIKNLYEPITTYLNNMSNDLAQIYPDINSEDFIESIADITFENGCKKITYYKSYLDKVAFIPDHEYFQIGQITLTKYRTSLYDGLKQNIDLIFEKLCAQHLWEVNDLCETFNMIHIRANKKSVTTEEVIETGKYMNWVKNEHLDGITARVEDSLASLCQIIDLGFLTEDHMKLNADVINWLDKISPVVEEHLVNFDQLKYDAEEKLQKIVEDVNADIKAVYPLLVILDDMDDLKRANSYLHTISLHMIKIKEIEEQISWINKEEVCLSFPKSTYAEYDDLKNYVYPFYHLLKLCLDVQRNVSVWQDGPFENLSYDKTKSSIDNFYKELTDLHKSYRKKLRQAQDENLPIRFKGTIDDPDILNWPAPLKLCGMAMKLIDDFKPSANVTKIICNSSLRKRHWKAMSEIARVDITPNAGTTLRKMMKIDFYANLNEYEIISAGATKEKQLIDNLRALELVWEDIKFTVTKYKGINILRELDEVEAVIDDHTIKVFNMKGSVFVKPHEKEVAAFYGKIQRINKTIDVWNMVQQQWVRLVPIFSTNNLSNVMPNESKLFHKVIEVYNNYIQKIQDQPNVMQMVETTEILRDVNLCLMNIEIIQQGVVTYLETIRHILPRLFFISDDELLTALSETNPLKSQAFLNKIFLGISQLVVNQSQITAMESLFNEIVNFTEPIDINNNNKLEELYSSVEQQMVMSLKYYIAECYKTFRRNNLQQIISKFPQQTLHLISQIFWTEHIKSALGLTHNIKLRIYYQKLDNTAKDKIRIINDTDTTHLDRLKLRNLIIEDLNLRYLVKKILESGYTSENQLDWEAHAKYYLEKGQVTIQLMNDKAKYMYEYLGNFSPIILTPLTDRCYRTLINAHQFHFSGLLRGPGDSGKSETIKSLAAVFGVFFAEFNCLHKLKISTLIQFITGSALCGSWLCLENFNNLAPGVLSVIAQNLFNILSTIKGGLDKCLLGKASIRIEATWFVTASIKTVRSLTELPDNLKVLFRTTTLISPDILQIVETVCYSLALENAKTISKKIMCVYNTYKDLTVTRSHYYFGVGTLKNMFYQYKYLKYRYPDENEDFILYNSLKTILLPTAIGDDIKTIDKIMSQIFPNANELSENRTDLEEYILNYCEENNLQLNTQLKPKVIEVYDSLKDSTGVIVLGETFTGKTTAINICEHLFTKLENKSVQKSIINPSSLHYDDLYGKFDSLSLHWSDGILPKTIRDFLTKEDVLSLWLIFDGNIDSSWIENVNDIISSNSKFYLESGDVLILRDTTLIFEVKNLEAASPSTISRCRVVYMPQIVTWKEYAKSWIGSCKSEWIEGYRELLVDIFNWIIPPCLDFIKNNCKQLCDLNEINLVKNVIHLTHMILDESFLSIASKEEDIKNLSTWIQATLISAGIAGLGSVLDRDSMQKFDEFYKLLWKGQNNDNPYPNSFEKLEATVPQDGLICNYQYIFKQRGIWKLYQDFLKNEKIVEHPYMNDFLVPTSDTLKFISFLNMHINHQYPVLLVGSPGTGKSLLIEHILLNHVDKEKFEIAHTHFNCNTNSRQTQKYILSKLNKRKNGRYSPPENKNFLLFIDNLNLITLNQHNSSSTLELLRQHLNSEVWYDLKNYNPIYLEDINIISAMNPTHMKQNKFCKRFLRHFNVFVLDEFSHDTMSRIYSNIILHVWKSAGFSGDITTIISQIVSATIKVYQSILNKCKPTLNKCYYVFNLTDFTKVIKTCTYLKKETYDNNKKVYLNLWSHEIQRVFGDRLNDSETDWLLEEIKVVMKEEFSEENEEVTDKSSDSNSKMEIVFSTLNDKDLPVQERRYEEVTDMQNLLNLITESLNIYNNSHGVPLNIVLFTYALEKLIKICRVISTSPGNVILLGNIGVGRQSLTKLATHLYNQTLFQPTIIKDYTVKNWDKDVKTVLKKAGCSEEHYVFLVTEEQLIDELFLENLDFLLRNGEIPNFYDTEEKQEILELTRLSAQGGNRNLDISSAAVFLYFKKKCKENLHLVLCHSVNDTLRNRIRRHPSLTSCYIIWFHDWPDESLECIGRNWINDLNLKDDIKQKVIGASIHFHRESQIFSEKILKISQIYIHVSSKAFIHFIKLFSELIRIKQNEIESTKKRFEQGLSRLSQAANQILNMQKSLAEYQPQLEEMTQRATEMTEQIALETIQVEKASALVREDEKIAGEQAAVAQILKSECEAELAQAIPILEDAISALNTLKPTDITLVKSMKNPPDAIKLVMAAVCVIKDVKPERLPDPSTGRKTIDYWGPSKRILGDMNFLQTLKDFDKDHIKPELMVKIRKEYLPHKDFKPQVVAKASSAAEGLCKWIIAMDMYDKVAKEVAPKKEKLEKAEREYAETMAILNEKKGELTCLEKKLADLNELLEEATQKQLKLQKQVDYCNKKLSSAQKLIGSLSEERYRWTETAKNLTAQYDQLPGNLLIYSGITAYLALLNQDNRMHVTNIWQKYIEDNLIPFSKDFDITKLLSSEKEKQFWIRNDIPNDSFFIVNAIIRKYSHCYSIFVDPNYLASDWIQKVERKNKITLTKFTDDDYLDKIKDCISYGKPILIHKIKEFIPPCLVELLQKQIFYENETAFVNLNNEPVKMDENFRLYMSCNLRSPYFSPEMYNRVTLIHFGITDKALEEELLKTVVDIEKPELKSQKKEIIRRTERDKAALLELEDKILNTLCESDMDILEDENAIKVLDESKDLVKGIHGKQNETDFLQIIIDNFNDEYRGIAKYSANLFYCINALKRTNYIYEFSLKWYMEQYFRSVLNAGMSKDTKQRCANIQKCFTCILYMSLKNCLLECDKLYFLFLLSTRILLFEEKINKQHLVLFLKATWIDKTEQLEKTMLKCLKQIEQLQDFNDFLNNFKNNLTSWVIFFEKPFLDLDDFTPPWNSKLNNFQKLTLIKLLRPDQLLHNIKKFISLELGAKFVDTYYVDLSDIYNHSYSLSPIIIFPHHGDNITQKLKNLAFKKQMMHRFNVLSLSDNQTGTIDNLIEEAQSQGSWILIQNCHLVPKWMQKLEERVVDMNVENTHENFRLWLTTTPSQDIPIELLQNSVKIVTEETEGIKRKLRQIYQSEPITNTEFYNGCPEKLKYFSRLLYALSFFHCILQEKRKFGILFSTTPYMFSDDDLNVSQQQLQIAVNQNSFNCEYLEKLIYIIVNCHYSANIDNEWDFRLLATLLKDCLSTAVSNKRRCIFNNIEYYGLPKKNDYKDYLLHISKLPQHDDPRLFGLSEFNVNCTALDCSKKLIASVLDVLEHENKANLTEQESELINLIDDILTKLPAPIDIENQSIVNTAIKQEVRQYKMLLGAISDSLIHLKEAFNGDSKITIEDEEAAGSILSNTVPQVWLKFSYPHQINLAQYIEDLCQRVDFFQQLVKNPEGHSLWLAAFFFPKAYICQIKIEFSRNTNIPLEDVVFDYEVLDKNKTIKSCGVIFTGLYIKGASWDKENFYLIELNNLYDHFPPVLFMPRNITEYSEDGRYICPVYQVDKILTEKEFLCGSHNFIGAILLPTKQDASYWVKHGVKLICQAPKEYKFM